MSRVSGTISKIIAGVGISAALASIIYDNIKGRQGEDDAKAEAPGDSRQGQPISCVVKLGGSACTVKDEFETANVALIDATASQLSQVVSEGIQPLLIHGAGSFGHFQAREYSVSSGGDLAVGRLREGFARTRISVQQLNNLIVSRLVHFGLPAVGLSPGAHLHTSSRTILSDSTSAIVLLDRISRFVEEGFLPVSHGDACLDSTLNCTILSGDALFVWYCRVYRPKYAVFLTDVAGVYSKPPTEPDAQLIRSIQVNHLGERMNLETANVTTATRSHDVTGGIAAKLKVACQVAGELKIPVYIVQAGSLAAAQALRGQRPDVGTTVECVA